MDLVGTLVRPREGCYVTNVCKVPLPEAEWRQLSIAAREIHEREVRAEMDRVRPRLVLAFGTRAASVFCPSFRKMTTDHGKPELGPGGKYVSMALWHPAALRGNSEVLGSIASDLLKVECLLLNGLVELLQPAATIEHEWPAAIGFLAFGGVRKSYKCRICGSIPMRTLHGAEVAVYSGEGLSWKLCQWHAEGWAKWAETHLEALRLHSDDAVAALAAAKLDRIAAKMQAELRGDRGKLSSRPAPAVGASEGMEITASAPGERSTTLALHGGSGQEPAMCALGVSESGTLSAVTSK